MHHTWGSYNPSWNKIREDWSEFSLKKKKKKSSSLCLLWLLLSYNGWHKGKVIPRCYRRNTRHCPITHSESIMVIRQGLPKLFEQTALQLLDMLWESVNSLTSKFSIYFPPQARLKLKNKTPEILTFFSSHNTYQ